MKSEYFIDLICHAEKIGNQDLVRLDKLIYEYPYFQAARILYLKAIYQTSSAKYRNELRINTIHLTDRKQFFKYLHNTIEFDYSNPSEEEISPLTDIVTDRIKEINGYLPVTSVGVPANKNAVAKKKEEDLIHIDFRSLENLPSEDEAGKNKEDLTVLEAESSSAVNNPLQLDHIEGVINDYEENVQINHPLYSVVERHSHREYVIETIHSNPGTETINISEHTENTIEALREETAYVGLPPVELFEDEEGTFKEDIEHSSKEASHKTKVSYYQADEDTILESRMAYQLNDEEADEESGPKSEKNKGKKELIDKFMQEDPGIIRIQNEPLEQRDLSKESVMEKEDLFSETLAKIYIKQKLYEKAIATYIKLSLKYPEKSVYFANRIEKIKDKQSSNHNN